MEFKSQRAIYLQIADHICEKILKKELAKDVRIPSVREFAVSIEVNPNTVVRTYSYLEEKEIIYKQRGIGYFVSKDAFEKVLQLKKENFLKQEWPYVCKMMDLLELNFEDLKKLKCGGRDENK